MMALRRVERVERAGQVAVRLPPARPCQVEPVAPEGRRALLAQRFAARQRACGGRLVVLLAIEFAQSQVQVGCAAQNVLALLFGQADGLFVGVDGRGQPSLRQADVGQGVATAQGEKEGAGRLQASHAVDQSAFSQGQIAGGPAGHAEQRAGDAAMQVIVRRQQVEGAAGMGDGGTYVAVRLGDEGAR